MFWQARIFTIRGIHGWWYRGWNIAYFFLCGILNACLQTGGSVVGASKIIMRVWIVCTFWRINSIKVAYNKLRVHSLGRKRPSLVSVCVCYDQTHTMCNGLLCCGFSYELHALQNYLFRFADYHSLWAAKGGKCWLIFGLQTL